MESTLASVLPSPKSSFDSNKLLEHKVAAKKFSIPLYGQRHLWIPKIEQDFEGGGAYPESKVAQYPRGLGRPGNAQVTGNNLALQVTEKGDIDYAVIAKYGHSKERTVQSSFRDLVPLRERGYSGEVSLEKPSEEEVAATTEKTKLALDKLVSSQLAASQPKSLRTQKDREPKYVRYTPANQMGESNEVEHTQRIIKMVNVQQDPMEPPKFRHKKIPRGPPSPPAPIMHSPPRRVSGKEAKDWRIPPAISNWKNPKGYTIPLDKRLAADGRGMIDVQINDKFAQLSEALYMADRHAREEVRQRANMQQKLAQKEKEEKEMRLRKLAQEAREAQAKRQHLQDTEISEDEVPTDDKEAVKRRENIRRERRQEIERDQRLSRMGAEQRIKIMSREQGRDISEKIALGIARPTQSKDTMYDARLFNQSGGLDSGFKNDDAYDIYDQPWNQSVADHIYRPSASIMDGIQQEDEEAALKQISQNDRFSVLDKSSIKLGTQERSGPVLFEKDEDDPFGTESFLASINPNQKNILSGSAKP